VANGANKDIIRSGIRRRAGESACKAAANIQHIMGGIIISVSVALAKALAGALLIAGISVASMRTRASKRRLGAWNRR